MNKIFGFLLLLTFSFSTLASDFGTVKFQFLTDDFTEKTTEFVKISGMEGKLDIVIMCSNQGNEVYTLQVGENSNFRFNRNSTVDVRDFEGMISENSELKYFDDRTAFFWGVRKMSTPTADLILNFGMTSAELKAIKAENELPYHLRVRARSDSNTETEAFKLLGFRDAIKELNCRQYRTD